MLDRRTGAPLCTNFRPSTCRKPAPPIMTTRDTPRDGSAAERYANS
jgi:hypothetical protein